MPFVCVQPMVTSWSRRTEDLTAGKSDEKVAVLIARLTAQLRCSSCSAATKDVLTQAALATSSSGGAHA